MALLLTQLVRPAVLDVAAKRRLSRQHPGCSDVRLRGEHARGVEVGLQHLQRRPGIEAEPVPAVRQQRPPPALRAPEPRWPAREPCREVRQRLGLTANGTTHLQFIFSSRFAPVMFPRGLMSARESFVPRGGNKGERKSIILSARSGYQDRI